MASPARRGELCQIVLERIMVRAATKKLYRANVFYGFQPRDGEAYATIWVESNPRRTAERQAIRELARARLNTSWEQPLDHRWQLVTKARRGIDFPTEPAAVDWFVDCFGELKASGMLDLIPTLGAVPPGEGDDET